MQSTINPTNGNLEYLVTLPYEIGYQGGKNGNNLPTRNLRIIIEKNTTDKIVTAFPE